MVSWNPDLGFTSMPVGNAVLSGSVNVGHAPAHAARAISARIVRAAHTNKSAPSTVVRLADNKE